MISMEKHRVNEDRNDFPITGQSVVLPLQSPDRREQFFLDLSRGSIDLLKSKLQNRGRQVVVLVRLDIHGAPHRNPDGGEITTSHLHIYREGYGDKWAIPVPPDRFRMNDSLWTILEDFMRFCNITQPPHIKKGLFT
ncbi:MAG: conserved hypothetical protein [Leptospirillum rubarum]|uniref:Lj965 prophage protein n=1 Tax=Leptospirillum sp. Group II '5-way CG' TaxID=419541 RepID=B6APA9_9BACT|nr:MAG: conserved hypothetical protein [Leptospirillum rubarum]EDZ39095.1 MAG: Conserved hypothetical protein [Leptospirillum sp. Group II '5-way CG']